MLGSFDGGFYLQCFIIIPGVDGEQEMPDTAWDEHVEMHNTIGELKKRMGHKSSRKRFTFPNDAELGLFYTKDRDSQLEDEVELIDKRIKKHHVEEKCMITLYAMPWAPKPHVDGLVDIRNAFFNGADYDLDGPEAEQRWNQLTQGWHQVEENFDGAYGVESQPDSWHIGSVSLQGDTLLRLQGEIPATIGYMDRLLVLDLAGNSITGYIPHSITQCVCLHSLYLQENELEGPLPFEIGSMLALRNLVVYENQLDGEIPSSLGDCKHLKTFYGQHNCFKGQLPEEMGKCSKLKLLYLQHNDLEGHLHVDLCGMKGLQHVNLAYNHLSGEPPHSLTKWRRLSECDLTNNDFEHDGAESFYKVMHEQIGAQVHLKMDGIDEGMDLDGNSQAGKIAAMGK